MRNHFLFLLVLILPALFGCMKVEPMLTANGQGADADVRHALVSQMSFEAGKLTFRGIVLADLARPEPVTTEFGTVVRGRTLNYLNFDGVSALVYGEDGFFATECEPHASFPEFGTSHPLCETGHGENFDIIHLCFAADLGYDVAAAQNWVSVPQAMSGQKGAGMVCWSAGKKMKSSKIYTY